MLKFLLLREIGSFKLITTCFLNWFYVFLQNNWFYVFLQNNEGEDIKENDTYFKNPPIYTSQILHPDETLADLQIKQISCPKLKNLSLLKEDSLGEYIYQEIAGLNTSIRGWNGDKVCVYGNVKANKIQMILLASNWIEKSQHEKALTFFGSLKNHEIQEAKFPDLILELSIKK